jgi:putative ABC transport system permease protein
VLDTIARGGAVARVAQFAAMAYVPRTAGTQLVQVTATEPGYPFYGEIGTAPATAWSRLHDGANVVVEPALLAQLSAKVGDTLSLGESHFTIIGVTTSIPGDVGVRAAFGARVFIPWRFLQGTGLLGIGARAEYAAYVRLAPAADALKLAERFRTTLRPERVRIRTVEEDRNNLTETLDRLGNYLGLVALMALLLGGLGVASAVSVFIRRKLDSIAASARRPARCSRCISCKRLAWACSAACSAYSAASSFSRRFLSCCATSCPSQSHPHPPRAPSASALAWGCG